MKNPTLNIKIKLKDAELLYSLLEKYIGEDRCGTDYKLFENTSRRFRAVVQKEIQSLNLTFA